MTTPIPIDASKARNEFFKILQRVYDTQETYLVKKAGIPMAIMKPITSRPKPKPTSKQFYASPQNP